VVGRTGSLKRTPPLSITIAQISFQRDRIFVLEAEANTKARRRAKKATKKNLVFAAFLAMLLAFAFAFILVAA
jgi:hypothetical protein